MSYSIGPWSSVSPILIVPFTIDVSRSFCRRREIFAARRQMAPPTAGRGRRAKGLRWSIVRSSRSRRVSEKWHRWWRPEMSKRPSSFAIVKLGLKSWLEILFLLRKCPLKFANIAWYASEALRAPVPFDLRSPLHWNASSVGTSRCFALTKVWL